MCLEATADSGKASKSVSELLHSAAELVGPAVYSSRPPVAPSSTSAEKASRQRSSSLPKGISKLRAAQEQLAREAEEAAYGKPVVTAKPVPAYVTTPMFHEMLQEMDERRKLNVSARAAVS